MNYTEIQDDLVRSKICELMSEMLDNPDKHGIYPTSKFMWEMESYILEFKAKIEQLETDLADQHNHWTKIMNENDAKIQQLEEENERLKDIINDLSEDCPNCNNMGSYAGGNEETGVEQIQCQWCYEVPNSKFNLQKALEE